MAIKNEITQGLILFCHISRQGSLSAAAQLLGMSRSSVSKQLAALEKKIGSRLFNRTTRKITLTDVGRNVLKEAHKVEVALLKIEQISADSQSIIAGDLNVSCASAQGRLLLVPLINRFLAMHPKVNVNLQLEDRFVDMVADNTDISIRVGHLPDSSLIARKLSDLSAVLCASPEYLSNAPSLKTPCDLLDHSCLYYRNSNLAMNTWSFIGGEGEETVTVSGPLSINDPSALLSAACEHAGVILIDKSLLGDTLKEGKLVPVLAGYQPIVSLPIYIVYPQKELITRKTRTLIDFILEEMPPVLQGG